MRDDRADGHVSPSDHSLSSSMILVASSRLKGPFILFIARLFRAGKVRRKASARCPARVYLRATLT